MDLERVKAHARQATGKAWPAQPVRSFLWRMLAPYFQSFAAELEERIERLERRVGMTPAPVADDADEGLALEIDGLRKDIKAIAHRLAGLEEETAAAGGGQRP